MTTSGDYDARFGLYDQETARADPAKPTPRSEDVGRAMIWQKDPEWRIRVAEAEVSDDGDLCVSDGEAAVAAYKRTKTAELEANFSSYVWLPQVLAVLEDSP